LVRAWVTVASATSTPLAALRVKPAAPWPTSGKSNVTVLAPGETSTGPNARPFESSSRMLTGPFATR
jgi:hypothetical protein